MATRTAQKRLTKEYKALQESPPPYIEAHPSESNILHWHYVITGPPDTPYAGGQYLGSLVFPPEYPFQPPSIRMTTPSGRFQPNTRLCLSISDYHPKTWNPAWSVSTILVGLLSFMVGEEQTTGSIASSVSSRTILARKSQLWNLQNEVFRENFPHLVEAAQVSTDSGAPSGVPNTQQIIDAINKAPLREAELAAVAERATNAADADNQIQNGNIDWRWATLATIAVVLIGIAAIRL